MAFKKYLKISKVKDGVLAATPVREDRHGGEYPDLHVEYAAREDATLLTQSDAESIAEKYRTQRGVETGIEEDVHRLTEQRRWRVYEVVA